MKQSKLEKCDYCSSRTTRIWTILNITLTLVNLSSIVVWYKQTHNTNDIAKEASFYSPVLDRLDLPLHIQKVQGTLFPPPNPSIGRQYPNPEADELWDELELTRTIAITEDDIKRLGKDPNTAVKLEDGYWGLGEGKFAGQIDVFHQLHCLNSLRKLGYPEYYINETSNKDEMWYVHHNHCVDILMQNLMCTANVDIITLNWMETQLQPFPDFSANRKCRDFNALLEWRKKNSLDMGKWFNMTKSKKATAIPAPPEYDTIFGKEGDGKAHELLHHGR